MKGPNPQEGNEPIDKDPIDEGINTRDVESNTPRLDSRHRDVQKNCITTDPKVFALRNGRSKIVEYMLGGSVGQDASMERLGRARHIPCAPNWRER